MTNLAEATADPALELDAGGNPIPAAIVIGTTPPDHEEGAVGGTVGLPSQPSGNESYPGLQMPPEEYP